MATLTTNSFTLDAAFESLSLIGSITANSFSLDPAFDSASVVAHLVVNGFVVDADVGTPSVQTVAKTNEFTVDPAFEPLLVKLYVTVPENTFDAVFDPLPLDVHTLAVPVEFVVDEAYGSPTAALIKTEVHANSFTVDEQFSSGTVVRGRLRLGGYTFDAVIPNDASVFGDGIIKTKSFFVNPVFGRALVASSGVAPETPTYINRSSLGPYAKSDLGIDTRGKVYKDLTLNFKPHPMTGDLTRTFDANAVSASMRNIILTNFYERPFDHIDVGANIRSYLFDLASPVTALAMKDAILTAIGNHETRAVILDISVVDDGDNNGYEINITWKLRSFEQTQEFQLFLERI